MTREPGVLPPLTKIRRSADTVEGRNALSLKIYIQPLVISLIININPE